MQKCQNITLCRAAQLNNKPIEQFDAFRQMNIEDFMTTFLRRAAHLV